MKTSKFKSEKLYKSFELGENQLATLVGGGGTVGAGGGTAGGTTWCNYSIPGDAACSHTCPDSTEDHNGN